MLAVRPGAVIDLPPGRGAAPLFAPDLVEDAGSEVHLHVRGLGPDIAAITLARPAGAALPGERFRDHHPRGDGACVPRRHRRPRHRPPAPATPDPARGRAMERETTFIHPTDLHIGSPEDPRLYSDTPATLPAVLDLVATVTPAPSFVVASGDLTNSGDAARYRLLRGMMAEVGVPVRHALGNHGTRAGFHEGMPDHPAPGQEP